MKCPHCRSAMQLVESDRNDKSQLFFYRCTVCVAEHVSSQLLTTDRYLARPLMHSENSRRSSQNFARSIV